MTRTSLRTSGSDEVNAATLSASEHKLALWLLSGAWQLRLLELLGRGSGSDASADISEMSPLEQFGLLFHLERQRTRVEDDEGQK